MRAPSGKQRLLRVKIVLQTARRMFSIAFRVALSISSAHLGVSMDPAHARFHSSLLFTLAVTGYTIDLVFFTRAQWFQTLPDMVTGCTGTFWLANSKCGLNG